MPSSEPIILAYSGGLDTSFCIPWLKENLDRPIITVTIDTGGLDDAAVTALEQRSLALGAIEHIRVDARQTFYDEVLRFLIAGNVRRGQLYPLCVGAERGVQATELARLARTRQADTVAHGCTAAGNDQVRFEVALRTINPDLNVLAPVRDNNWARDDQLKFLEERQLPAPAGGSSYSINRGLWGITIGGQETLTSEGCIPESAWVVSKNALAKPLKPSSHRLRFADGEPVGLDGTTMKPLALIEALETLGGPYGIGRGVHLGDTVLGTKGRVAFEAPAAEILLTTHRELEKLTLSALQLRIKEQLSLSYGDYVHEGKQLDPVCRDIEAFLVSTQKHVNGEVHFDLRPGSVFVTGTESDESLLAATRGVYGEAAGEWTASDALGYARILSLPGLLQARVAERKSS